MRNLIIKRRSSPAGQDSALHIYGTSANGQININNVPCQVLGSVSDGETVVIPIGDEPIKIYITDDLLERKQSCEYCQIPAGNCDLFISGKREYAPAQAHPFLFDKNDDAILSTRQAIGIMIAAVLLTLALIAIPFIVKAFSTPEEPITYEAKVFSEDGIQITLTDEFREMEVPEDFEAGFISEGTSIRILREEFFNNATMSAFEYAQAYINDNPALDGVPFEEKGFTLFEYTERNPSDGKDYTYLMVFMKGPDAFWIVEFSTFAENAESMRELYLSYAATICFPGNAI